MENNEGPRTTDSEWVI